MPGEKRLWRRLTKKSLDDIVKNRKRVQALLSRFSVEINGAPLWRQKIRQTYRSYQIFISIAAKRNNTAMLDRLFEGLSSDKILEIFFRYFDDKISKNEWLLDNARAEFPEMLCIYLRNDIETLSSARQDFKLFIKYLAKVFKTASENDRLIFLQALFPLTEEAPWWSGDWTIGHFACAERELWEDFAGLLIKNPCGRAAGYFFL